MKIIAMGSEAVVYERGNIVIKRRKRKGYRIRELDEKLRKSRGGMEFRIMQRLYEGGMSVPQPLKYVDNEIWMEKVAGTRLAESFRPSDAVEAGKMVAELHKLGIIHGDLTTANIMMDGGKQRLIDFGLSYYSTRAEDRASDLFLFKNAIKSKHNDVYREAYRLFLQSYKDTVGKEFKGIDTHLKDIEERRRYNENY